MTEVFRIQDMTGRGPWRPGFSEVWSDTGKDTFTLPNIFQDFGMEILKRMRKANKAGLHCGCACIDLETLNKWFSEREKAKLLTLGFQIVSLNVDVILARSKMQIVYGRLLPNSVVGKVILK